MLYETLSQPMLMLCFLVGGFSAGFLFDIKNMTICKFKHKKTINHFLTFFATFFMLFIFYFLNLRVNYGQLRLFTFFIFFCAFALERHLMVNFVANPLTKCYHKLKDKQNERRKRKQKAKE